MSKFLVAILGLSLLLPTAGFAAEDKCDADGEALIIAKISKKMTNSLTYCVGTIDEKSVELFFESSICPLALEDVLRMGVHFPLQNGHDCEISVGQKISGVLVLNHGTIRIEK